MGGVGGGGGFWGGEAAAGRRVGAVCAARGRGLRVTAAELLLEGTIAMYEQKRDDAEMLAAAYQRVVAAFRSGDPVAAVNAMREAEAMKA